MIKSESLFDTQTSPCKRLYDVAEDGKEFIWQTTTKHSQTQIKQRKETN